MDGLRLRQVWRQAAGAGGREASHRGARDLGVPGSAHGRCEPDPSASATPGLRVLRRTPPQPRDLVPLPRPSWEGRPGQACPRRLRGLSTGPAHSSAGTRHRPSSASLHPPSPLNTASILPIGRAAGEEAGGLGPRGSGGEVGSRSGLAQSRMNAYSAGPCACSPALAIKCMRGTLTDKGAPRYDRPRISAEFRSPVAGNQKVSTTLPCGNPLRHLNAANWWAFTAVNW